MNFTICKFSNGYQLHMEYRETWTYDILNIGSHLSINFKNYIDVLKEHGAQCIDDNYCFQTYQQAQDFLTTLEPYTYCNGKINGRNRIGNT